jgi:hypothetical protein
VTEIGLDVLDPSGTNIFNLAPGSTGLVGTNVTTISTCPALDFFIQVSGDCDDANAAINPIGFELL